MKAIQSSLCALFLTALPVLAQDVRWELIDTGVLDHTTHGQGIEMRIKPEPFPNGLFDSDDLSGLAAELCKHYAPSVIPYVQQQTDIGTPDFIAVRIVSGGAFGRYFLQAYAISDDTCAEEL
jgi:hypothetical protein